MICRKNVVVVGIAIEEVRSEAWMLLFSRGGVVPVPGSFTLSPTASEGLFLAVFLVRCIDDALVLFGDIPVVHGRTKLVVVVVFIIDVRLFTGLAGLDVLAALDRPSSSTTFGLGSTTSLACTTGVDMGVKVVVRVVAAVRRIAVASGRRDERGSRREVRSEKELLRSRVYAVVVISYNISLPHFPNDRESTRPTTYRKRRYRDYS